MIQEEGIVSTGAGMHSPHPLQVMAKSQSRAGDPTDMEPSIGEQKAKRPVSHRCNLHRPHRYMAPVGDYLATQIFRHIPNSPKHLER